MKPCLWPWPVTAWPGARHRRVGGLTAHDMVSHHVRLGFQRVVDRADFELRQNFLLGLTRSALALHGGRSSVADLGLQRPLIGRAWRRTT